LRLILKGVLITERKEKRKIVLFSSLKENFSVEKLFNWY